MCPGGGAWAPLTEGARSQQRRFARPASPQCGSNDQRRCSAAVTPAPAISTGVPAHQAQLSFLGRTSTAPRRPACLARVQVKNLEWEAEVLAQRFAVVQAERDSLHERFEASVYDVAQKTGAGRGSLLSLPSMSLARVYRHYAFVVQCPQGLCLSAGSCREWVRTVLVGLICVCLWCVCRVCRPQEHASGEACGCAGGSTGDEGRTAGGGAGCGTPGPRHAAAGERAPFLGPNLGLLEHAGIGWGTRPAGLPAGAQRSKLAAETRHSAACTPPYACCVLLQVNKKLEEVLTSKNSIIRALQYDVAKVTTDAHMAVASCILHTRRLHAAVMPALCWHHHVCRCVPCRCQRRTTT